MGCISDLHLDINFQVKEMILQALKRLTADLDYLLIGGDIANELENFISYMEELSSLKPKIFIVPGNHDVWLFEKDKIVADELNISSDPFSSWHKHDSMLKKAAESHNINYLPNNPVIINNDTLLLGNMGWYDYSFKNPDLEFSFIEYAAKTFEGKVWNDGRYCRWFVDDPDIEEMDHEVLDKLLKQFRKDFQKGWNVAKENEFKIKNVIFLLHHIPFKNHVLYKEVPDWDYFSAFMGSEKLGELIIDLINKYNISKSYVISGHTHSPSEYSIEKLGMRSFSVPLGYLQEQNFEIISQETISNWVANSLRLITL